MKHVASALMLAMLLACLAAARPGFAAARLVTAGEPTALLTNEQRAQFGIKFGPDAPIDFYQGKDGRFYLNSAGALGPLRGPARQAAWNLHVDSRLTHILALHGDTPATGPQDVQVLMTDFAAECGTGRHHLAATDPGGAACARYFDRDYAGGGTYYRCPNGTSVYFYHGENHTAPDGTPGPGGWFGLGVGIFNADETAVTRAAQMPVGAGRTTAENVGMNMSTRWGADGAPPQQHPFNGVPSVVPGPDGFLYLFHGNATLDPAYNPSACHPECMGVSRAPAAAFCQSIRTTAPVRWVNFYRGAWSEPAVLDGSSALGFGAGGAFTPLFTNAPPGEHGGTVTYLPAAHLFAMTRLAGGGITIRLSPDGLHWGEAAQLVGQPTGLTPDGEGETIVYPKISVLPGDPKQERTVLTYVLATKGHFWRWAAFMRQELSLHS